MRQAVEELLRGDAGTPEWEARAASATPATHFAAEHLGDGANRPPPFLLLHGDADTVVPIDDSRSFKRALDAHGVPSVLVELHEQGHGFAVLARKEPLLPATCTAWAFLDRVAARP
jgi:acetyl esterase/lipase